MASETGGERLPVVWPRATERLREDPAFGPLVEAIGPVRLRPPVGDPFRALVRTIVYQQLAGAAAGTIHRRLVDALDDRIEPGVVLAAGEEPLRAAGLSRSKTAAVLELARRVGDGDLALDDLDRLDDEGVRRRLVQLRGIGPWTAQMVLLFDLRRPDVWPTGDLGVRIGLGRVLGRARPPDPAETALIGTGYRPWRSAVAWYCWRAVDGWTPDGSVST